MTEEPTTEPARCLSPNTPGHANGSRCKLPVHVGGYCKRHARIHGVTRLCMKCGLWHVMGECRKAEK